MPKFMHRSLLVIYVFAFAFILTFNSQSAPKHQTSPNDASYLVPKSGAPNPAAFPRRPWERGGGKTQIQSHRNTGTKSPMDKNARLIAFQAKYPNARIVLHDATGLSHVISNIQSQRRLGNAVQIARDFLREHRDLLMPDGVIADLELIEVMRSRNAQHVHFKQVYRGVLLHRGLLSVHIQDGRVVMYTGTPRPPAAFRDLPLQPTLGESQATDIAMQQLQSIAPVWLRGEITTSLYIYPAEDGTSHLAYQVQIPAGSPLGDWEFLIDAHTGKILEQNNLLMHVNGSGSVYEENPITTRNVVNRVLPNLDGSGFLRGDFVDVVVYNGPADIRVYSRDFVDGLENNARSTEHDFRFNPNDSRFDEANVYFHINRIHDFFKNSFDFTGRDDQLLTIVDHPTIDERDSKILSEPMNNAFFSGFTQSLAIGEGTGTANGGLNNLARDADVLYHEYTHAVVDRITALGIRPNDMGRAMNEAYADYFPCSFFNDPDMGEWSVSSARGLRNLDNNNRFPDHLFEPHTGAPEEHFTGLIWGGACWTLRERIGQRDADPLIFNSLFFLPRDGSANFQIGLTVLLQVDESIFDGAHQETIREVFNARGICELAGCPLVSGVSTRAAISSVELLGVNQYTIEVPGDATALQVDLRAVQTGSDIDLYVRFNQPVAVQRGFAQPEIIADHRSEGPRGTESITITSESSPRLQAGTYYVGIVNWTDAPPQIDYDLTATIDQTPPQDIPLTANVPQRDSIGPRPPTWRLFPQYTIEIGDTVQQLDVIVTPDDPQQDLDFAVRLNQRVELESGRVIADVIDQKPTSGGTITLIRPALQNGTYFIAVGNFDTQPARFTIEAKVIDQPIAESVHPLTSGESVSGSSGPGTPPVAVRFNLREQYTIDVPTNATSLTVKLEATNPELDLDLAVRHDEPIQVTDGQLIADFLGETPRGIESIVVNSETTPPIRGGTYYIAVGSFASERAAWTLTATVATVTVSLSPTSATIEVGEQQGFNATVSGTENPTVIWDVMGVVRGDDVVGTIDNTGLYTAPFSVPDVNPVTVRATSLVDQTQSASALVTIVPPVDRYIDLISGIPVEGEIGPGVRTPRETIWKLNEQYRIAVPETEAVSEREPFALTPLRSVMTRTPASFTRRLALFHDAHSVVKPRAQPFHFADGMECIPNEMTVPNEPGHITRRNDRFAKPPSDFPGNLDKFRTRVPGWNQFDQPLHRGWIIKMKTDDTPFESGFVV